MKRIFTLFVLLCLGGSQFQSLELPDEKSIYTRFLQEHPFNKRPRLNPAALKEIPKQDRPDLAWEQDYLATLDPALGRPTREVLLPIYQQVAAQRQSMSLAPGAASSPWEERGPDNVGGRTRALMWDPNAASGNKVWAGGVTGGLWYNNDITNSSSNWIAVDDFWDNISITAIAYDPTNTNTFYVATGEGWGAGAARGEGIWKSTDGGLTWNQLASTTSFFYVNDLIVRNESGTGVVYAACDYRGYQGGAHGNSSKGLQRSTDGGTTWNQTLPNVPSGSYPYFAADIELGANNRLWVGTIRTHLGTHGGTVLYSDDGTNWTVAYTVSGGDRVELACAPGNSNYVYAITEVSSAVGDIARTTDGGLTWTTLNEPSDADNGIPATDFSRGQAWYDLIIAVDPNDANTVITGGIDLFRTTDGGTTWSQISKWSNNNNLAALNCSYVHADQHQIVFKPGSSSTAIFGNDGGVFYTTSLATAATSNVISDRNNGYNVTQFYACAIHPSAGQDYYLAGAQDNGTQRYQSSGMNSTTRATGGDGAYCFVDQSDPNYQVTSYVYNSYWRSTNGGNSWGSRIQSDQSTGKFINPTDYDDVQNVLYSARTTSTINRISNMTGSPSISNFTISGMTRMASHLRVSPYTTSSTTLFVGTENGDLFKVTNADGASPSSTNIAGSTLPNSNVSCIEIGASENELLVTFSNYGVNSVWYTNDGGTTWISKEGDLPNMPVRWALFNPNNRNEVILATEVGIWSTAAFNAASPSWSPSNSGLANVRVDMLQIRDSDKQVIAATHGRGLFSSNAFNAVGPTADFSANKTTPCANETVLLTDLSTNTPTSWTWSISPGTFTYANSTSASSQNPEVQFTAAGNYQISLTSTNSVGSDTETKTAYIAVTANQTPAVSIAASNTSICAGTNVTFTATPIHGGTSPAYQWKVNGNNAGSNSATFNSSTLSNSDVVTVELTSDLNCVTSATATSNSINMSVTPIQTPAVSIAASSTSICTGTNVTFTATPTNEGSTPAYQWKVNGNNVGTNSNTYSSAALNNGDVVTVELTSSLTCVTSATATSNAVNMNVSAPATPGVSIATASTTICSGATTNFTATPTNGGPSPSYQWKINGNNAGTNSPTFSSNSLNNGDVVTVEMTSNAGCVTTATATSNALTMTTSSSVSSAVSASASSTSICQGTSVTFTATPTNGGTSPTYQWKVNGNNVGTNSDTYTTMSLLNNDVVTVELTSSLSCASPQTTTSTGISMTVSPSITPGAAISTPSTTICAGTIATFTANINNGGTAPTYQWTVNGSPVGNNSSTYTSNSLSNGDMVRVDLTSNASCVSQTSVSSNTITMTVTPTVVPTASITAGSTTICEGEPLSFTASVSNEGNAPVYQWKLNGANVGSNSPTYSVLGLNNGDVVGLSLTSNANCATPLTVNAADVTITVVPIPVAAFNISIPIADLCKEDTTTLSATPAGGTFSGPGVSGNTFIPLTAGSGSHDIYYEYTNSTGCYDSDTMTMNVDIVPKPLITQNGNTLSCTQGGYNYTWLMNGMPAPGTNTAQNYTLTGNGVYTVRMGSGSCFDDSDPFAVVDFSLDDLKALYHFSTYPNPVGTQLTLRFENPGSARVQIELYSFNGSRVLYKAVNTHTQVEEQLSLSTLARGMYTLKVRCGEALFVEKIEKM
jgi:PKD repeat protein